VLIFCKNILKPNTACIQKSLGFLQNTPLVMFLMLPFVHNKDVKEQTLFLTNQKNSYVGAFIPVRIHSRIPSSLVWSNFCWDSFISKLLWKKIHSLLFFLHKFRKVFREHRGKEEENTLISPIPCTIYSVAPQSGWCKLLSGAPHFTGINYIDTVK
jgi:hypothetical protein